MSGGSYPINFSASYEAYNFTLGATGSTGSGNLDVSPYTTKSAYAYIHTTQNASGSLVVSGSLDASGTNYFTIRSGSFNSGSLQWFTFYDAIKYVSVNLYNQVSGSAISGSLYLNCRV